VETPAIRQRVVDNLAHVDPRLARKVAEPLALAAPDAKAAAGRAGFRDARGKPPLEASPSLSMDTGQPGPIATRKVAVLVAPGVEIGALKIFQQALAEHNAVTRIVAAHLGVVATSSGQQLAVDHAFLTTSSVLFDAVLVPGGAAHAQALARDGDAVHFVLEAYRHCKPVCVIGDGAALLRLLGLEEGAPPPPGVLVGSGDPSTRVPLANDFITAIGRHRQWLRPHLEAVPA
jgi:catalase